MNGIIVAVLTSMVVASGATGGALLGGSGASGDGPVNDAGEEADLWLGHVPVPEAPPTDPSDPEDPKDPGDGGDDEGETPPEPRPPEPPEAPDRPEAPSRDPQPDREEREECSQDYTDHESRVVAGPPGIVYTWTFPVECYVTLIDLELALEGIAGTAYVDFDNAITLYDGAGAIVAEERTSLNTGGDATLMFDYQHNGPLGGHAPGEWVLELATCFIAGTSEFDINVQA